MTLEQDISKLVDKYNNEVDMNQTESDVRAGYIDLLFEALGWNVRNNPNEHTNYRRENYIPHAGFVDVRLEIANKPVLMLEAKKFGIIATSTARIFDRTIEEKQLFRYARGKQMPYCILTNFERLHVFNADHERLILAFDDPSEYLTRLPELLHLTPEKVENGSLAASERQLWIKDIDTTFLYSLQVWRRNLANAIYRNNQNNNELQTNNKIDFEKLMAVVQRILDRLILIRFADDKEILLNYDVVENMLTDFRKKGGYVLPNDLLNELTDFSHRMDMQHNTSLFQPGDSCEKIEVPNETLEPIMSEMNNISFRKFTSDILGNTYESYLSTKLILRNGEVYSEDRDDLRKEGGIYYTPTAVVHYIVDNTLGNLLEELEKEYGIHSINKVKELKIVDPACGSGSFLIFAYQKLAEYYRMINSKIADEKARLLATLEKADMFQNIEVFKNLPEPLYDYPHHILEKQIFGVEIDPEAAEIASVNLTMQAIGDSKKKKLPKILNENIKIGNSILDGSADELHKSFGDNWRDRKPFSWTREFMNIVPDGKFDMVIGNPPYVGERGHKDLFREIRAGTFEKYYLRKMDEFYFFIHLALDLCKDNGYIGMITTNYFLTDNGAKKLREDLHNRSIIQKMMNFNELKIFESAKGQHNIISILKKGVKPEYVAQTCVTKRQGLGDSEIISKILSCKDEETSYYQVSQVSLYDGPEFYIRLEGVASNGINHPEQDILQKMKDAGTLLTDICHVNQGVLSGVDKITQRHIKNKLASVGCINQGVYVISKDVFDDLDLSENEKGILKPYFKNSDIKQYSCNINPRNYLIYITRDLKLEDYPQIQKHLLKFEDAIKARSQDRGEMQAALKLGKWWVIFAARDQDIFNGAKIVCPQRSYDNCFAYNDVEWFAGTDVYFITPKNSNIDLKYVLANLNSKLFYFWLYKRGKTKGEMLELLYTPLTEIPIKQITPEEQKPFIDLVDKIMDITRDIHYLKDLGKTVKVKEYEQQINKMVYELYKLKPEERDLVENMR
jgi:type I restriction-modification system DNA methylase subunit